MTFIINQICVVFIKMVIGSHNSWSYLPLQQWWMKPFFFIARCQSKSIYEQYHKYNVRCFDLRIRFDKNDNIIIAHGFAKYKISDEQLADDLDFINSTKDSYVRVLLEIRNQKAYTDHQREMFRQWCDKVVKDYPNIIFWCGRSLVNYTNPDYIFKNNPSCEEKYSSVCKPLWVDDWCPWIYAKLHNKENIQTGTDKNILLIDFVNIQ